MVTIDDYLRKIPLVNKDVAVVGPNFRVGNDPSLLYFANRMAYKNSTLTVLDAEPHWVSESHGNIHTHMHDFESMIYKGIRVKWPEVIIGDVTKTTIEDRFDLIYESGTFKCIVNLKASLSRSKIYKNPARQVICAYHKMLKKRGCAILVFSEGTYDAGYSTLIDLLQDDMRFEWRLEPGIFIDFYVLKNINRKNVQELGRKQFLIGEGEDSTPIRLNKNGYVRLGSGYKEMHILKIQKKN